MVGYFSHFLPGYLVYICIYLCVLHIIKPFSFYIPVDIQHTIISSVLILRSMYRYIVHYICIPALWSLHYDTDTTSSCCTKGSRQCNGCRRTGFDRHTTYVRTPAPRYIERDKKRKERKKIELLGKQQKGSNAPKHEYLVARRDQSE